MQSFIISSKNPEHAFEYALSLCKKEHINIFDITILEEQEAIGIEMIRDLHKKLSLKPFKSLKKAAIIKNAHTLTLQAQHAMLKLLEEPPVNTIIIALVENKEQLLLTISSRCSIIELKNEDTADERKYNEILRELTSLQTASISKKFKHAQDLSKDKTQVLDWLEKAILASRKELFNSLNDSNLPAGKAGHFVYYVSVLKMFQKTHTIIKTTNTSPRLALENLFLNLNQP